MDKTTAIKIDARHSVQVTSTEQGIIIDIYDNNLNYLDGFTY